MVQGIILTHGHEDHIGSLAFVLKELNVPVYGTRLTIGFTKGKLSEYGVLQQAKLHTFTATDKFKLGHIRDRTFPGSALYSRCGRLRRPHACRDACAYR